MNMKREEECPCKSGKTFGECCAPVVAGEKKAATAEELMRARYTSYVTGDVDFLRTSAVKEVQDEFDENASKAWSAQAQWHGLEIVGTQAGGEGDDEGIVEFRALYTANGEFCNQAFTAEELSGIIGESKVTMLSAEEALKYYEYDSWRMAEATKYAVSKGARIENGSCWWWLTDKGSIENSASYIHFDGTIRSSGFSVDYSAVAVRPIIWVSSEAETETEEISEPASEEISE
jgi:uncharacterized protein YchJ